MGGSRLVGGLGPGSLVPLNPTLVVFISVYNKHGSQSSAIQQWWANPNHDHDWITDLICDLPITASQSISATRYFICDDNVANVDKLLVKLKNKNATDFNIIRKVLPWFNRAILSLNINKEYAQAYLYTTLSFSLNISTSLFAIMQKPTLCSFMCNKIK